MLWARDDTQRSNRSWTRRGRKPTLPPDSAPAPDGLSGVSSPTNIAHAKASRHVGRGWSDRLLASLRAFNGIYDTNVIQEIKKFGGSNVFARLIAMKCRGTSSLLRDVYLGTDKPWGLEPISDPDVPDEIVQAIAQHIGETVTSKYKRTSTACRAQAAHQIGTAAAHAMGKRRAFTRRLLTPAIPSHQSGPSQGAHTGAIPPGAPPPPGGPTALGLPAAATASASS